MADTESERRTILEAVADGSLSPEEAAERLAALDERSGPAPRAGGSGIRRVRIVSTGHAVRVVADPGLAEPIVEGPHRTQREGDTLVVRAEVEEAAGFFFASVPSWRHRADPVGRAWRSAPALVVRLPPALGLQVDATATSVAVRDVKGPIALAVAAGSATVAGFAGPLDIDLSAGSVSATGVLDGGESSVRCSAGSVKLHLARGSNVRVKGVANAGRLALPFAHAHARAGRGPRGPFGPFGQEQESVVGTGAGVLDIEVTTGSVIVAADG